MSARTCQLCGKPLSKIWIGAGEFCSREHRNQYRMRRGMDRLLEANQVANVIRRREVPKPISSAHPPEEDAQRAAEDGARFGANPAPVALPSMRWRPRVTIPASRGPLSQAPRWLSLARRDFGILRGTGLRVVPGFRSPEIEPPGAAYLNRARRPKGLAGSASVGARLRVSASAGFRLQAIRKDHLRVPAPREAALAHPDKPFPPRLGELDRGSSSRVFRIVLAPRITSAVPRPTATLHGKLEPPGLVRAGGHPANGFTLSPRSAGELRVPHDGAALRPIPYQDPGRAQSGFVPISLSRVCGMDDPRLALVPLAPQEGQLRYAPVISVAVERAPIAPAVNLEDNFDGGMEKWLGGVEDWRLDVAGARTGALALFKPSLALQDYELEFLARIDQRSVSWVYRATGFDDYYTATISALPAGGHQFTRGAVTGGAAQTTTTVPCNFTIGRRAAFTVRLRAAGDRFSVWVDGNLVESWTDGRLATGGIGFSGAPDDRARLYWVRLSRMAETGKELSSL